MDDHLVGPQVHPAAEVISLCSVAPKEAAFPAAMAEAIIAQPSPSSTTFTQTYYSSATPTSAPSRNTTAAVVFPPSTNISANASGSTAAVVTAEVQQCHEGASYPPLLSSSTVAFDCAPSTGGHPSPSTTSTCVNQYYYSAISNNPNNTTQVQTHQQQQQQQQGHNHQGPLRFEGVENHPFVSVALQAANTNTNSDVATQDKPNFIVSASTNTSNVTTCFPHIAQFTKNEQKYVRGAQEPLVQNAPGDSKSNIAFLNRDELNGGGGACRGVASSFSPPFSNSPLAPAAAVALPLAAANDESINSKYSLSNRSNNGNTINSASQQQHSSSCHTNINEIDILTSVISRSKGKEVVLGTDTCVGVNSGGEHVHVHHGGLSNFVGISSIGPSNARNNDNLGMAIQIGLQHKHSRAEECPQEECRPVLLYPNEQALNDSQSAGRSLTQSHHLAATRKGSIQATHEPQSQIARGGGGSGRQRQINAPTNDTNNDHHHHHPTTKKNNYYNAKKTTTNTTNNTEATDNNNNSIGTNDNKTTLAMASGGSLSPLNNANNRNLAVPGSHHVASDCFFSPPTKTNTNNNNKANPHLLDDNSSGSPSRVHQQSNHLYNITATQHQPHTPHHHDQPPFILATATKFDINPNTTAESSTRPQSTTHGLLPLTFTEQYQQQHVQPQNPAHTGYATAEAIRTPSSPGGVGGDAARSTDNKNNAAVAVVGVGPAQTHGAPNYDVARELNAGHQNQQQKLQYEQQQFYQQSSSQQPRTVQTMEQNASNNGLAWPLGNAQMMNLSLTDPPTANPKQVSTQPTPNTQRQSTANAGPFQDSLSYGQQQRQNQSALVAAYLPNTPYYPQVLPVPTAATLPFSAEHQQQQQHNPLPLVAGGGVVHSAGTHPRGEAGGLYPFAHSYSPSPFGSSAAVHPPMMGGERVAEQQQIHLNHLYNQQIQEEQHRQLYHKQQHLQQQQQHVVGASGLTVSSSYSSLGQPSISYGQEVQQNSGGLTVGAFAPQLSSNSAMALNSVPNDIAAASALFSYQQQQQWIMIQQQQQQQQLLQQQYEHQQQMQRQMAQQQQQQQQISYNYNNNNNPLLTPHHAHGQQPLFLQTQPQPFVSSSNVLLSVAGDPSTSSSGFQPPLLRHISIPNIAIPASSSSASLPATCSGSASTTPLMVFGMGGAGQGQGVSPFSTTVAAPHQQQRYLQLPSSEQYSGALHIPTMVNAQQGVINVSNNGGGAIVYRVAESSDQTPQSQNVGVGPKSTPLSKQRNSGNTSGACFPSPAAEKRLPPPSASRRKTSYCNYYPDRVHLCPFGDQCAYAHTREDRKAARERLRTKLVELEEQLQQEEAVKLKQQGHPQQDGVSSESAVISYSVEHV